MAGALQTSNIPSACFVQFIFFFLFLHLIRENPQAERRQTKSSKQESFLRICFSAR
jgi:hypothetical protein